MPLDALLLGRTNPPTTERDTGTTETKEVGVTGIVRESTPQAHRQDIKHKLKQLGNGHRAADRYLFGRFTRREHHVRQWTDDIMVKSYKTQWPSGIGSNTGHHPRNRDYMEPATGAAQED